MMNLPSIYHVSSVGSNRILSRIGLVQAHFSTIVNMFAQTTPYLVVLLTENAFSHLMILELLTYRRTTYN